MKLGQKRDFEPIEGFWDPATDSTIHGTYEAQVSSKDGKNNYFLFRLLEPVAVKDKTMGSSTADRGAMVGVSSTKALADMLTKDLVGRSIRITRGEKVALKNDPSRSFWHYDGETTDDAEWAKTHKNGGAKEELPF